ncbi:MAG TPA: TolC family protein [Burkholderiales bacterium]|nr:TolC family protein [Burkholderiales bacterium]
MKRTLRIFSSLLVASWLGACSSTALRDPVSVNIPGQWSNAPKADNAATTRDLAHWWKGFEDPVLDDLVARALAANQDLKLAVARVREARAYQTVAESVLFPTVDATADVGRNKSFERLPKPTVGTTWNIGVAAAWEIDLFGGNRFEAQAASAQTRASQEARRAVQVGVLAEVATSYLELRGAQKQIDIVTENIAVQRKQLQFLEARYRAGLSSELDIARQQQLIHTSQAALALLTNATAALSHRIAVLLGKPASDLESLLARPAPLPSTLPEIPGLLPSDLFAQRPDIRRAQAELTAAAAKLSSAKTDLFPKFVLSARGGRGALDLDPSPNAVGNIFALGLGVVQPLFNAGRIRANIEAADARLSQVAARYEKTYLTALEEVEDAFVAHTTARERREELTQAAQEAARAEHLAEEFYKRGITDFLAVLDSERVKLTAEDERAKAETAVSVSMVSLYRAFGGGWTSADTAVAQEK